MKHRTVTVTIGVVVFFMLLMAALLFLAPWLIRLYLNYRVMPEILGTVILAAFYTCCPPAAVALGCMFRLLANIRKNQAFCPANPRLMTGICWCCMVVAAVTAVAGYWYPPLFFVAGAMLFIFLIVRVVRSCFVAAIGLKEENSLTI